MDRVSAPAWFAERYPAEALARRLRDARVGGFGLPAALLGALCGSLLAVEVATGALLALYYRADRDGARASVQRVITHVEFGELVRSLHGWASHALLAALFALLGVMLAGALHRKPHEVAFSAVVAAWFAALASAFTGALLPWTSRSALEATVASGAVAHLPLVGPALRAIVFGGVRPDLTDLARVQGLHMGALPALWALLGAALALHALGRLAHEPAQQGVRVMPELAARMAAVAPASLGALLILAVVRPLALGAAPSAADALAGEARPSWFMAPLDALLRIAPADVLGASGVTVVITLAALLALGAVMLPWIERALGRATRWFGLALYALVLGVMVLALLR